MIFKWIKLNSSFLFRKSWNFTSILYSTLGFLAIWCSLESIFPHDASILYKICSSILIFVIIYILLFICTSIWYYYHNSICVINKGNGRKVYVEYGDFIEEIKCSKGRTNFVIPTNRCFDTNVDDKIISSNSIHGAVFKHLYYNKLFSPNEISSKIAKALKNNEYVKLSNDEKPAGNRLRYPIGTIADIEGQNDNHYYLLGLTTLDKELTAHSSKEDFILPLQSYDKKVEYGRMK